MVGPHPTKWDRTGVGACHTSQQKIPSPIHTAHRQSPIDLLAVRHPHRYDWAATGCHPTRCTNTVDAVSARIGRPSLEYDRVYYINAYNPSHARHRS